MIPLSRVIASGIIGLGCFALVAFTGGPPWAALSVFLIVYLVVLR